MQWAMIKWKQRGREIFTKTRPVVSCEHVVDEEEQEITYTWLSPHLSPLYCLSLKDQHVFL
jgi:hypothetical protein